MAEHDDQENRRGILRRLTLVGPDGTFLDRRGIDLRLFGIYLHRIVDEDPGRDLHDHPWPFVTLILSGGYTEERADARLAPLYAAVAEQSDGLAPGVTSARGHERSWRRWSIHRIRMTDAHRITSAQPNTWTLVFRGRKSRRWGFYLPTGYVDQERYDYAARRPGKAIRRRADPITGGV